MFDGVHRGHSHLLRQVIDTAALTGLTPALVTFSAHPSLIINPQRAVKTLTDTPRRLDLLRENGASDIILLDFNDSLRHYSARQFLQMLHDDYAVDCLIVGFNNRFGHNRAETFDDYRRYGSEIGMDVIEATESTDCKVSSSIIRRLLECGDVEQAALLLGRPFMLEGTVVEGKRIGHKIGFPTANIRPSSPLALIPASGVYAVRVTDTETDERHPAMLNIGCRPTVNADCSDITVEAHLLDFSGNLYGHRLGVEFLARLRDEKRFDSLPDLKAQLIRDAEAVRELTQQ